MEWKDSAARASAILLPGLGYRDHNRICDHHSLPFLPEQSMMVAGLWFVVHYWRSLTSQQHCHRNYVLLLNPLRKTGRRRHLHLHFWQRSSIRDQRGRLLHLSRCPVMGRKHHQYHRWCWREEADGLSQRSAFSWMVNLLHHHSWMTGTHTNGNSPNDGSCNEVAHFGAAL